VSAASTAAKSWMLPGVTVTYGYAITQSAASVAQLDVGATLLFAYRDANYLRQEKRFRRLGWDDAQVEPREVDVTRRAGALVEERATGLPRTR
jgi:histidine triad (HIT) family protein